MSEVVVIGFGNPLRGDDGVGWYVVNNLKSRFSGALVRYRTVHQLVPELAEEISLAKAVVFIDCAISVLPGAINRIRLAPEEQARPAHHHVTPETLLSYTRELYGRSVEGILFTVSGKSFEFEETLTPEVQRGAEELVEEIGTYLSRMDVA